MSRKATYAVAAVFVTVAAAGAVAWQQPELLARLAALNPSSSTPPLKPKSAAPAQKAALSVAVEAAMARATTTADDLLSIGSLQSDESVQISSEIAGRVESIKFVEGTEVAAGDVLFQLDDVLARAELADAEARLKLAEANLGRAESLSRTGNVTGRARDEAIANADTGRAAVELSRARIAKHTITAPFNGIVGLRKVSPGAYVGVGTAMVNLEKIDPLKVSFSLPEVNLADVRTGQNVEVTVDALPGRTFTGDIYAIDPQVDVNGRSVQIRATVPNTDRQLRPGLFARIAVKGANRRNVVMVPESAVVPRGEQNFVYRIEAGKAQEVSVKLGARRNAEVEILEGLIPQQRVVTAGQLKLRNGASVDIIEATQRPARS